MTQLKSLKLQHRRTKLKTRTKIQLSERIKKRCSALAALIKERKKKHDKLYNVTQRSEHAQQRLGAHTHCLPPNSSGQSIQNIDFRWGIKLAFDISPPREETPTRAFHDATRREHNRELKSPVR